MSPRRVLAEHSSRELTDWLAFERVWGLDTPLDRDVRAGIVAAALWNVAGGIPDDDRDNESDDERRAARPSDFFPRLTPPDEPAAEPASQDEVDSLDDWPRDDDTPSAEAEAQTLALKNAFAAFGIRHNAALRRIAEQGPPDNPDAN